MVSPQVTLLGLCLLLGCFGANAKVLNFVWNSYCPYTCEDDKVGQPGFAKEIVKAVFDDSPYLVRYHYVLSWNRAMTQVKSGERDAIVFSFHETGSDHHFVIPSEPLMIESSTSVIVRKNNPWRFSDTSSLSKLKLIGVYKGTIWVDPKITQFEQNNPHKFVYLHGDNIVERAIDMVRRGRIDAWEDSEILLDYYMFRNKVTDMRIESLPKPQLQTGDLLFSRKNPKSPEYAAYFSKGIRQLRQSGQLQKILDRYGLKDWR